MNSKNLIPNKLLKLLPLTFMFLDRIYPNNSKRRTYIRATENKIYNSKHSLCKNNYRLTSKLL